MPTEDNMPLTFATFYIDISEEVKQSILAIEPSFTIHKEFQLLQAFFASARRFHPDCRTVILTDLKTVINLSADIEIMRFDVDNRLVGFSRTLAQKAFLKQTTPPESVLFLDYDMLIQSNLDAMFQQPFDVALTYRRHPVPINGGFIAIHGDGYEGGLAFMEKMVTISHQKPQYYTWFGNQRALVRSVGVNNFFDRTSDLIEVDHIRILFLPGELYNFSTPDDVAMDGDYPDKKILHFKGRRKEYLLDYFKKMMK